MKDSRRRMVSEWHCRVWETNDERDSTTWPVPVRGIWSTLREKLHAGSYGSRVELTQSEALALRSLVRAYLHVIDAPRWVLDELVEAICDAERLQAEEEQAEEERRLAAV